MRFYTTLLLYGIVPVKTWLLISCLFAYDLYRLHAANGSERDGARASAGKTNKQKVAHLGHVAGMLFGASFIVLRKALAKARRV
jgi:hypothetical protein